MLDASDTCSKGSLFTSNTTTDADGDGCNDDPTSKDGDLDTDGVRNSVDVDDDNDGLIEIATATELNNIRYSLDGTHYDDEEDDSAINEGSNAGCSTNNPVGCNGYELADNIDLSIADFVPIGNSIDEFSAILDGNGNAIHNLFIDTSTRNAGLFTSLAAGSTVRNLSFATGSIVGSGGDDYVGVLAGTNSGAIFNVSADLSVSAGDGGDEVGGLVGKNSSTGTIVNSSATGDVDGDAGYDRIGGLVGVNEGTIQNSYATGTANGGGDGDTGTGGLAGVNEGTVQDSYATGNANGGDDSDTGTGGLVGVNEGTIQNSYATGIANGNDGDDAGTGGLVGLNHNDGTISNSYATGTANGGAGTGTDTDYVGGLVGGNDGNGTIRNSYSLGAVDGGGDAYSGGVGRLVGLNGGGVGGITGNYYNATSGVSNGRELILENTEAKGKTLAQLKELTATTTEADFGASNRWNEFNWNFGTNTKYPSLKSYKKNADGNQIDGTLLCEQPDPDFVQCTTN